MEPDNVDALAIAAALLAVERRYGEWNSWSNNPSARCGCGSATATSALIAFSMTDSRPKVGDAEFSLRIMVH